MRPSDSRHGENKKGRKLQPALRLEKKEYSTKEGNFRLTMMEKYTRDGPGEVRKQMNRQAVKKEGFFYHPPFIFCFWTFIRFSLKTWLLYFKNLYLLFKSQIPSHVIIIHYSLITIVCFFCLPLFILYLSLLLWLTYLMGNFFEDFLQIDSVSDIFSESLLKH